MNNPKIRYLYVAGASFSGSTLLAFLLNAHPRIASFSEMGPHPRFVTAGDYPCSCGRLLLQCPFFLEMERRVRASGIDFSLQQWQMEFKLSTYRPLNILLARPLRSVLLEGIRDPLVRLWPRYRSSLERTGRRISILARATLEMTGKDVFADGQKDSIRIKFLSETPNLDLRVVHLVRDVRGSVTSFMKHGSPGLSAATRVWLIDNLNTERARRFVPPDRWMRVRYERLCEDPQGTLDSLADFVGVPRAAVPADIYQTTHHILGNNMRLKADRRGIVNADESWRNRLSERELAIIARIGGAANRHFGHPWPPPEGSAPAA